MKKIFLTMLSAGLVLGFISCNGSGDKDKKGTDSTTVNQKNDAANAVSSPDDKAKSDVPADADKSKDDGSKSADTKSTDSKTTTTTPNKVSTKGDATTAPAGGKVGVKGGK